MMLGMRRAALALVLAVLALAGCGGRDVDEAAYRSAVELQSGGPVNDMTWSQHMHRVEELCDDHSQAFEQVVGRSIDDGAAALALLRTDLQFVCPDRVDEIDTVIEVRDALRGVS